MGAPGGITPMLILLAMGCAWGLQFTMLKLAVDSGYGEMKSVLFE